MPISGDSQSFSEEKGATTLDDPNDHPEIALATGTEVEAVMRAEILAFLTDDDPVERMAAFGHASLSVGFLSGAHDLLARATGGKVDECPMTNTMVDHALATVQMLLAAFTGAIEQHPDTPDLSDEEEAPPVH